MILFIISIIILNIILIYLIKDFIKIIRINSILLIVSGYLIIVLNYILRNIINNKLSFINISKITNIIYYQSINKGLLFILFGSILLIIYSSIIIYRKYLKNT